MVKKEQRNQFLEKCEEEILDWEVQGILEEWGLSDVIGHQQVHFIISIDLVSVAEI